MRQHVWLVAALTLLPGCFYPADRGKQLEARVDKLEAEKRGLEEALNRQRDLLAAQIPKLDGQVEAVQNALDKLDRASRSSSADIGVQMETVKQDINMLRGNVEQYLHKLNEMEQQLGDLKAANEARGAATAQGQQGQPSTATPKKDVEKPTDKKAFAELVTTKLAEDPGTGRSLADDFLKKWGKDPLAARVHYELGSSYLGSKDYRAALAEFGEIVRNFAKSEQAPSALLKSSECFAALKMKDESRLALEEIVSSYPKSDAAKEARSRLAELKKAPAKGKGK